jgi:hypothetical protein
MSHTLWQKRIDVVILNGTIRPFRKFHVRIHEQHLLTIPLVGIGVSEPCLLGCPAELR